LNKPFHGVFTGDAETLTNQAWANQGDIKPIRQDNGNDMYLIPFKNAGYEGGAKGSKIELDKITIITVGGTNKVVTAYPSQ